MMRPGLLVVAMLLASTPAWSDPDKTKGNAAFGEAQQEYQVGNYLAAAEKFKVAYGHDPDPGYLFNIAQAYRLGNDCVNAADYYRRFLDRIPKPPNLVKVQVWLQDADVCANLRKADKLNQDRDSEAQRREQVRLDNLERDRRAALERDQHERDLAKERLRRQPATVGTTNWRRPAIVSAGVGLAALGVAVFFTWDAQYLADHRTSFLASCTVDSPCSAATASDYDKRGHRAVTLAVIGYSGAGLAIAGSAVMYMLARRDHEHPIALTPIPNGAMIVGGTRF